MSEEKKSGFLWCEEKVEKEKTVFDERSERVDENMGGCQAG